MGRLTRLLPSRSMPSTTPSSFSSSSSLWVSISAGNALRHMLVMVGVSLHVSAQVGWGGRGLCTDVSRGHREWGKEQEVERDHEENGDRSKKEGKCVRIQCGSAKYMNVSVVTLFMFSVYMYQYMS